MMLTKSAGKTKPQFAYRERSSEDMQNRQRSFSGRDSYFSNKAKFFVPKVGSNKLRILPPTWEGAEHYGLDIYVHYGIGPDNVGYLCLDRMEGDKCPLCEARLEADKNGDEDLTKALRATRRVAVYVVDRNAENEGPKVWAMPQTVDKEICAQAWDKESGEVFALDNPDEGYDVSFEQEGTGPTKKYIGVRLARRASPVSDEDTVAEAWLQHITDNPVPDMLVLHDYDHIKLAFEGKGARKADPDSTAATTKGKAPARAAVRTPAAAEAKAEVSSRPRIGAKKVVAPPPKEEPTLPTWEEIHELDGDGLYEIAQARGVDFGTQEFTSLEACQDWLCEQLEITEEEEVPPSAPSKGGEDTGSTNLRDRLRKMSKK